MMGPTHRLGGILAALGGWLLMWYNGWLLPGVEPVLQLVLIYPFAYYGATFPDLDHHAGSIPSRDVFSLAVNKVLHLTTKLRRKMEKAGRGGGLLYKVLGIFDAKHRSWQTHSDLTVLGSAFLTWFLASKTEGASESIILLVGIGFTLGVFAHYVYDAITPDGVYFTPFSIVNALWPGKKKPLPKKLHLVPRRPIRTKKWKSYFATGQGWEGLVNKISRWAGWVLGVWVLILLLDVKL